MRVLGFILLFCGSIPARAQVPVFVEGRVVGADSVALGGATVTMWPARQRGTATDTSGRFRLAVPSLPVEVEVRYVGYATVRLVIRQRTGTVVALQPALDVLGEAVVTARRMRDVADVQAATLRIGAADVRELPAVLGEPDVFRTLQLLPGVRGGVEGQSGLYVRGGGPDENLVLLDGLPLYGATHVFGFLSAFPSEAVGEVELQKGGFAARHGGRLSSVVDVRMRAGDTTRAARLHLGVLAVQAQAEGRVPGGTALVAGRRSFVDLATRAFSNPENAIHPAFADLYARYDAALSASARLAVSGYGSRDRYASTSLATLGLTDVVTTERSAVGWDNGAAAVRLLVDRGAWSAEAGAGAVGYAQRLEQTAVQRLPDGTDGVGTEDRFQAGVRDLRAWVHAAHGRAPALVVSGGAVGTHRAFSSAGPVPSAFEGGTYAEAEAGRGPVRASVGVHVLAYAAGGQAWVVPQPRLRVRVLAAQTAVRVSYTRTAQAVHGVVNLLDGLPVETWIPATAALPPSRADQWTLGVQRQPVGGALGWSAEAFVKRSRGILTRREGVGRVEATTAEAAATAGRATSVGVELFAEGRRGRWTGWAGYTLAQTTQAFDALDGGQPFPSRFDRRHDVRLVGRYRIGPRASVSATWLYGTGDAVTLPTAIYAGCAPEGPVTGACFDPVVELGPRNGSRLPAYHRLDLGYRFERASGRAAFSAGVYNAYGRPNPFSVDLSAGFEVVDPRAPFGPGSLVAPRDRLTASVLLPFLPYVHYEVRL